MNSSDSAEKTAEKQRGRPFAPGQSGNPSGRPKGVRNKATVFAEALLDGEGDAIIRKVIQLATEGDIAAIRLCLERLIPPKRENVVAFELPSKVETAADVVQASTSVLTDCAQGNLSPNEAARVMALISAHLELVQKAATLEVKDKNGPVLIEHRPLDMRDVLESYKKALRKANENGE